MTVYLIHFKQPIGNQNNPRGMAQHYLGSTDDLVARLKEHETGAGARLMQVVGILGIEWCLARTWPGGRKEERHIKNRHESPRLCPICQGLAKGNKHEH